MTKVPRPRRAAVAASCLALLFGCTTHAGVRPESTGTFALFEKPSQLVAASLGASLSLYCSGTGRPTVILESGVGGDTPRSWHRLLPLAARHSRVCAYDRAGFGFSRLGEDLPRDLHHDLADLRDVVRAVGDGSPVVLIGHSMGGTVVAAYVDRYPTDVAGLVLIEPAVVLERRRDDASDTLDTASRTRFESQLRAFTLCAERFAHATVPDTPKAGDRCLDSRDFAGLPPRFARIEAGHRSTPDYWRALESEMRNNWFGLIARQAADLLPHAWGAMPVRVITAAVSEVDDSTLSVAIGMRAIDSAQLSFVRQNHRQWEQRQAQLCSFSTDCKVTRVRTAAHVVQDAAPDTVVAALRSVIARVRSVRDTG